VARGPRVAQGRAPEPGRLRARAAAVAALAALSCAAPPPVPEAPPPSAGAGAPASEPAPARDRAPTGDLPVPLPPPALAGEPRESREAPPGDPLELLWAHRLDFSAGAPLVTIRLLEGQEEIAFRPRGPGRLEPRGSDPLAVTALARLRARSRNARPATVTYLPLLAQVSARSRSSIDRLRALWEGRGVRTRVGAAGGIYGIAGKVIDNRRLLLLAEGTWTEASAEAFAASAFERWGERPEVHGELVARPSGEVEVLDDEGAVVTAGDSVVVLEAPEGFTLERVPREPAQPARGVEDRSYPGRLLVTLDASGRLAAVAAVELEALLRGLVPSEMPAGSPTEALKAQAVTARSNVLAQIGTRHLADPWALCSDVHCQAYRGEGAHAAATDAAVRATEGEALFGKDDRRLVDGVYSAMCGGHGEDNDAVWENAPDPSLRGRPDLPAPAAAPWAGGLSAEPRLRAFLGDAQVAWCARAPGARPDRYRWERRFTSAELDQWVAPLGVGRVRALTVLERGRSGRARTLRVEGERAAATIRGELRIRRLLGSLPSAMFLVAREGDSWVLRGGGWGHGVGMCQWGAIGRAAAGQDYRQILRAYFSGAEAARVY